MTALATSAGSVGLVDTVTVLVAAVLHAAWNALARAIADQLIGFALMGAAVTACALGVVLASPAPSSASWPFLAGSAVLHVAYNLLLMRCYRLGECGQVYLLARAPRRGWWRSGRRCSPAAALPEPRVQRSLPPSWPW